MCATVYGWCHLVKATEVTAGLAENNGSLPPGGWLKVTCGLSACTLRLALGPTLLLFSDLVGLYIVQFYQEFLLLSEKGAKYCDEYACLSVCLSVRMSRYEVNHSNVSVMILWQFTLIQTEHQEYDRFRLLVGRPIKD